MQCFDVYITTKAFEQAILQQLPAFKTVPKFRAVYIVLKPKAKGCSLFGLYNDIDFGETLRMGLHRL